MKIAIIGAGAIGSIVSAELRKAGVDCLLVGRPEQVTAIQENGLVVRRSQGTETVPVRAAVQLDQNYDLVIFTVKTQDLEQAYQDNHQFLEECLVLTTQNGVQADNLLSTHFEPINMMNSIVMFGATYTKPGEVTYNFPGDWILGKPFTTVDPRVWETAEVLKKAFPVTVTQDIMGMKWLKIFVNFNNCLPALVGKSMQETFSDLGMCRISVLLLREGVQIVQKAGITMVSLPQFPVERILGLAMMPVDDATVIINKTLTTLSKEPLYGSVLQSIMRGKPSEIDFINGEVTHLAHSVEMKAPLNRKIVEMVHRVEREGKFLSFQQAKHEFAEYLAEISTHHH